MWTCSPRAATRPLAALTQGREFDRGPNMLRRQLWEIGDDLLGCHARRQILQNVIDGDSGAHEAGLSTTHTCSRLDERDQIHEDDATEHTDKVTV